MPDKEQIWILDGKTKKPVEATLNKVFHENEMAKIGAKWQAELQVLTAEAQLAGVPPHLIPQHTHWNWAGKGSADPTLCRRYAIEKGGEVQGMMILLVRHVQHLCRLREQKDQESVYVDYLQTAPQNWTEFLHLLNREAKFKSVGRALITAAIDRSRDEGCQGRVALHSLSQAEGFYGDTCRMATRGPDDNYHNLRYFEMTTELSDRFTEVK